MADPLNFDELWPVTITPDRYGGVYSGGRWLAFLTPPELVPDGPFGSDPAAVECWAANDTPIGLGETPNDAYADLVARLDRR